MTLFYCNSVYYLKTNVVLAIIVPFIQTGLPRSECTRYVRHNQILGCNPCRGRAASAWQDGSHFTSTAGKLMLLVLAAEAEMERSLR